MNNKKMAQQILGVTTLLVLLLTGCGETATATSVPETPPVTSTPKSSVVTTLPGTSPAAPTPIPTSGPVDVSRTFVPRVMLPSTPPSSIELLGSKCNYQGDIWAEKSAYIAYLCPDLNVTWLSSRFTSLDSGERAADTFGKLPSEANHGGLHSRIELKDLFGEMPGSEGLLLSPGDLLSKFENLSIIGRLENEEFVYFLLYEQANFAISIEVFFPEDAAISLEEFYSRDGEVILASIFDLMLEKVHIGEEDVASTPVAVDKDDPYSQIGGWLVTEAEVNELYQGSSDMWGDTFDGTWAFGEDEVDKERESVCRNFVDQSNADAPLVTLFNCVYHREPGYELIRLEDSFPYADVLESTYGYPEQSVIYGHKLSNGHTALVAFVLQDDFLFYVFLESRTLVGQTPQEILNGYNDGFIYSVMSTNLERFDPGVGEHLDMQDDVDPFIGNWISTDPWDGSSQQMEITKSEGVYNIDYHDDVAGSCGLDAAGNTIEAGGTSTGFVEDNVLSTDITWWCLSDPKEFIATVHIDFNYESSTDTISDGADRETIWERR